MEYSVFTIVYILAVLSNCLCWESTVEYDFTGYRTSPPDGEHSEQSSGQGGTVHGHFQSHSSHSSRTSSGTYSSDSSGSGSGSGEPTLESPAYCSLDEQLEELRARISVLEEFLHDETNKQCCANKAFVGFTAYLSRSMSSETRSTLKFDHVILNEGNGYDIFTGKFKVPVSGFYSLSYFVSTEKAANCNVRLLVDGVPTLSTGTKSSNEITQNCDGGQTGILRLYHGQSVWIETHPNTVTIQGGYEDHVTSFSGALLHSI